jgi:hypothetical protein
MIQPNMKASQGAPAAPALPEIGTGVWTLQLTPAG